LNGLLNQRVDLRELRPELARQIPATISPAVAARRISHVAARMVAGGPPDALVCHVRRRLDRPGTRVEAVAEEVGLSERQLRRRLRTVVGYGPKTLQRVLRFQRFLARLRAENGDADLAGIALDLGYADQPHLTREATRLSGFPPAALAKIRVPGSF
jgi:AraC-like DNA-binding protein